MNIDTIAALLICRTTTSPAYIKLTYLCILIYMYIL